MSCGAKRQSDGFSARQVTALVSTQKKKKVTAVVQAEWVILDDPLGHKFKFQAKSDATIPAYMANLTSSSLEPDHIARDDEASMAPDNTRHGGVKAGFELKKAAKRVRR